MNLQGYEVFADDEFENFEFLSIGRNGTIRKIVMLRSIGFNIYNLAFGDMDEMTGGMNDKARSNNGDRNKVLATVAEIVIDFLANHPGATILAIGATPSRSRLYQIGLNILWQDIQNIYFIEGYVNGEWEYFNPTKNYEAFTIKTK
ncbi:MAG TPA: hypothetical protein VFX73_02295 [Chitinophagaceae bacterium]|nr:hypothetical protein [Chitinophagaceae bacterium]